MIPKNSVLMVAGLHFSVWILLALSNDTNICTKYLCNKWTNSGCLVVDYAAGYRQSYAKLIQIATWSIGKEQNSLFIGMLYVVNLFCFV